MPPAPGVHLFPALLKHWRGRRGLSQLDLALAADVSARHVSFLETGRAQPSREMVLRLATALSIPLRDQNQLLLAAGHAAAFEEVRPEALLAGPLATVIDLMLAQHEPFPMVVMGRGYEILRTNRGAAALLARFVAQPELLAGAPDGFSILFDPRLARPFVEAWPQVARAMLSRLHRECLERPDDEVLAKVLSSLFELPDVPTDWQVPDLAAPSEPLLAVRLRRGDLSLSFLTTVTVFSAPQNVTLEELRIESYFPADEATRRACAALAG